MHQNLSTKKNFYVLEIKIIVFDQGLNFDQHAISVAK